MKTFEIDIYCDKCGAHLEITQSYADGGTLSLNVVPCECIKAIPPEENDIPVSPV